MRRDETAKFQSERNSKWILGFYVKAYTEITSGILNHELNIFHFSRNSSSAAKGLNF